MITPRLQSVMDLVDAKTISDIGTDHAYIPIKLALDKKIEKAVAADKNIGPIKIAKENVEKYHLSDVIDLRVGDGLDAININETDIIIIAGMGGNLIGDIIERDIDKAKASTLILQPMNAQYELRKRLEEMGFRIVKEELAKEGFKVYNILKVTKGVSKPKEEIFYHIPEELLSHKLVGMLIDKKEREFNKILNGMKLSDTKDIDIINKYEFLLKELIKVKNSII